MESKTEPKAKSLAYLASLVKAMRAAQRAYFRRKTSDNLTAAKDLEHRVDELVAELLEGPQLF